MILPKPDSISNSNLITYMKIEDMKTTRNELSDYLLHKKKKTTKEGGRATLMPF